jgi:GNAT superfamily N-acetyltransferase
MYLKRAVSLGAPSTPAPLGLEWVPYAPDRETLFERAIQRTYVQSQDCPELTDLRETADVLAGHRATGVFDPGLWWVAMRGDEPVGAILLNRLETEPALEVVYMGVAQLARGQGVADALLARAVDQAAGIGANILTLAVDQRNTPARRLYARWAFVETGVRDAWIASPCRI